MQLFNHGARTIHNTFGLMDGRYDEKELIKNVMESEHYGHIKTIFHLWML